MVNRMHSYKKIVFHTALEAAQNFNKYDSIYEEGTPNKYFAHTITGHIMVHNGLTWKHSGFPLNSQNTFYALVPLDK